MKDDLTQVVGRMQTLKINLGQFESSARHEGAADERTSKELERMKSELAQKKSEIRKLGHQIQSMELRGGGHNSEPQGAKQREFEEKKKEFQKLENESSEISHQIMRMESDLKNIK